MYEGMLENILMRLVQELGLVANLVLVGEHEKIVGGSSYDDRGGIGLYVKKYEILFSENEYHLKLPVGQTFLKKLCSTEDEVVNMINEHFGEYHKNIKLSV